MDALTHRSLLEKLVSVTYDDRVAACRTLATEGLIEGQATTTLASAYSDCGKEEIAAFLFLLDDISPHLMLGISCASSLLTRLLSNNPAEVLAATTLLLALGSDCYTKEERAFENCARLVRRKQLSQEGELTKEQLTWAKIRELAIWLLLPFAGRARETLIHIAFDSSIWPIALTALGVPGPGAQKGIPALIRALSMKEPIRQVKDHPAVQLLPERAASSLANLGPQAHNAIPDILEKEKTAFISTRFLIWQAMPALHPSESHHGPSVARSFINALPSIFSYCEDLDYDDSIALNIARKLWPLSLASLVTSPRRCCSDLAAELMEADGTTLDDHAKDIVTYLEDTNWPATMFMTTSLLLSQGNDKKGFIEFLERLATSNEISPQALVGLVHALAEEGKVEHLSPTFHRLCEQIGKDNVLPILEALEYLLQTFPHMNGELKTARSTLFPKLIVVIRSPKGKNEHRCAIRDEGAKFLRHFCPFDDESKKLIEELYKAIPPSGSTKYLRRYLRQD